MPMGKKERKKHASLKPKPSPYLDHTENFFRQLMKIS
jgi:hypothetical protein